MRLYPITKVVTKPPLPIYDKPMMYYPINALKFACLEGIAYHNGRIFEEKMRGGAKPMLKNQYGQYLLKVIDEMKKEVMSATMDE